MPAPAAPPGPARQGTAPLALGTRPETALADADGLAALPGFGGPALDPLRIPAPGGHALQRRTRQRGRFQDASAAARRRPLDLIRRASPALERVLPDPGPRLSLALLRRRADPGAVPKARSATIAGFIARRASGNHPHRGPFVDALVEALRQAARDARQLHRGHVDVTPRTCLRHDAELQAGIAIAIDVLAARMTARMTARAGPDRRIEALCADLQPGDVLRTIAGVGREVSIAEAKAPVAARHHLPDAIRATRRANRAPAAA